MRFVAAAVGFAFLAAAACGSSSASSSATPTAPTSPSPAPTEPAYDISGNWSGSFQSSNLATRPITMTIVQSTFCVDGVWKDSTGQWTGAISGIATSTSFAGLISYERSEDGGGKCTAVGNVQGPIGGDGINWNVASFSSSASCAGDLPQSTVITLHRS